MVTDERTAKARKELEDEHAEVMRSLGEVFVAVEAVKAAKPTDNIHDLLLELQKQVKKARDGGLVGSGANDHRRALKKYLALVPEPGA